MTGFWSIIFLSFLMGIASFISGCVPLAVVLSPTKTRIISTVGMGILASTSMIVIIPEGVETLYNSVLDYIPDTSADSSNKDSPSVLTSSFNTHIGLSLFFGFFFMYLINEIPLLFKKTKENYNSIDSSELHVFPPSNGTDSVTDGDNSIRYEVDNNLNDPMQSLSNNNNSNNNRSNRHNFDVTNTSSSPSKKAFSTVIGLVVHAIADGVALGASASTGSAALEGIIFLAIMVHKAPASFGLSAVLLRMNLTRRQIAINLGIFASAAPLGAIFTWVLINLLGSGDVRNLKWWTGILLIFSGGTFLFVAIHLMQEMGTSEHSHEIKDDELYDNEQNIKSNRSQELKDVAWTCFGMLLPLFTLLIPDDDI